MHGIARYVHHLISELARLDQSNRYTILISKHSPLLNEKFPPSFSLLELQSKFISLKEQFELPRILREIKADLFHSPSFVAPLFCPCPIVMTIHDLNHIVLPQYYTPLHKFYYLFFVQKCIERSTWILTVSEFSKREIMKYFNLDPSRIKVTYNSVSSSYTPVSSPEEFDRVRKEYELPDKFILYVGNNKPHKNFLNLVRAYCQADVDCPLVACCPVDVEAIEIAAACNKQYNLYFTKFITDRDLPVALSMAEYLVYPSTYEGFGLPPLESMACGTPVILSKTSCLPEIAGDAALYVDPYDVKDMATALETMFKDQDLVKVLRDKGLNRVKEYSWSRMAQLTLGVYHSSSDLDRNKVIGVTS